MLKDMARFATLLAAVVAQGIGVARADVRELVEAGKITWTGTPAVIYLNADGTTASSVALLARDGASLRLTFAPKGTLILFR